ncbi:MAG: cation:proton antiporter, partial [Thermodesulfobacteriota bacterium]
MSLEEVAGLPVERFLLALALVLVVSKLFGEMAERIKQPAVLGELLAGVVLGASVLAIVPSVPGQAGYETFHLLAELGVVILLFEIGLETNLRDLIRVG